jgi:hypothetical protein
MLLRNPLQNSQTLYLSAEITVHLPTNSAEEPELESGRKGRHYSRGVSQAASADREWMRGGG